jgi:hypothetical protein
VIGGFFYEINYITTDNKYNKNGEQTISFYVLDDVGDVLPYNKFIKKLMHV